MEISLKIPVDEDTIRAETFKLRALIAKQQAEISLLSTALKHYQKQCKHPGQKTGYNERDGSWANPCPVCGESH